MRKADDFCCDKATREIRSLAQKKNKQPEINNKLENSWPLHDRTIMLFVTPSFQLIKYIMSYWLWMLYARLYAIYHPLFQTVFIRYEC